MMSRKLRKVFELSEVVYLKRQDGEKKDDLLLFTEKCGLCTCTSESAKEIERWEISENGG